MLLFSYFYHLIMGFFYIEDILISKIFYEIVNKFMNVHL